MRINTFNFIGLLLCGISGAFGMFFGQIGGLLAVVSGQIAIYIVLTSSEET